MIKLEIEMTEGQATAFAQFLKRVGLNEYRQLATDIEEAYDMQSAGEKIRDSLTVAGFSPR